MIDISEFSMAKSYVWWHGWFQEKSPGVSKLEEEGYVWRSNSESFNKMLNGRVCPICHNQGFIYIQEDKPVYCLCKVLEFLDNEYEFQSAWASRTLDELDIRFGGKELQEIVKQVRWFIQKPEGWHYLYGGLGSGKTHILHAIKTELKGLALYLTTADLNGFVFKSLQNKTLDDLIDTVSEAEILLLDDFGAEYPSEFFLSTLYTIINRRYVDREMLPTIFTSNLSYKQLAESSSLEMRRIADRIFDRQFTNVMVTKQPSYRQKEQT